MDPTSDNSNRPAPSSEGGEGSCGRGSIAERRAAKCGFKAERINTARFRTDRDGPLTSSPPVVRSPLLTIPPGISPTALLDSPILLPNSQPSPTTGFADGGGGFGRVKEDNSLDDTFAEFAGFFNQGNDGDLHALVSSGTLMDFEFPAEFPKGMAEDDSATGAKVLESSVAEACFVGSQDHGPEISTNRSDQQHQPAYGGSVGAQPAEEQKGAFPVADAGRTSEDGFNWRKYGQKQVKGSEYPRSYYKCTHTNCQVKKKIERSHDGQITEIIYKGTHNHPKPQPNRRALPGAASSLDGMPEMEEESGTSVKPEGVAAWRSAESGSRDFRYGVSDRRFDGMERTSSTSVVTELSDPQSATQGRSAGAFEPVGTPELSSTLASLDDNEDDGATQASPSLGLDFDDEESESKRRRIDSCLVEANITSRAVREPRVVVQIESEVDILDDGYRWRKYGQKVVKGNPNPRSYYKCTSPGCLVRKHVERASHNLKFVITTYEGKHNHEVPAARNSTHANSGSASLPPNPSSAHTGVGYGRNTNGPKSDSHMQDFTPTFDRKPMFNDYPRSAFPRNLGNDAKLGPASMYPMKFPSIQSAIPYGSYGCNSNQAPMHHPGSIAPFVTDFPITMPSSIRASPNISLGAVDFHSNGKFSGHVQQFLSGQQMIRPKQEQKDNVYDVGSSITDQTNVSSVSASSSLYQQIMGNFSS